MLLGLLIFLSSLRAEAGVAKTATQGQQIVSQHFRMLSAEIDEFFSSRRTSYLTNHSQFRVGYLTTAREYEPALTQDVLLGFNLVLPETQKKLRIVVERKPRKLEAPESPGDVQPPESPDQQKKSQTAASVRYFMWFTDEWSVSTDVGFQFEPPAQPFTRARIGKSFFPVDVWELRISEEIYYFFIDRWRFVTSFDSDHTLTRSLLFRIGNELTWNQVTTGFDYVYGPSLYQKLSPTQAIGYHLKFFAQSQPNWMNTNVALSVVYRQLIIRDWFYYELIPAVDMPRTRDWQRVLSFSVKLEAVF